MKIRKIAAISVLVLSSFAANNVAPSKAELEAMYDKAFREFDATNFPEALKQLDAIDARQPDLPSLKIFAVSYSCGKEFTTRQRRLCMKRCESIQSFGTRDSIWPKFHS